jgi:hypothetical protein
MGVGLLITVVILAIIKTFDSVTTCFYCGKPVVRVPNIRVWGGSRGETMLLALHGPCLPKLIGILLKDQSEMPV